MVAALALLAPALGGCTVSDEQASDLRIEGLSEEQRRDFVNSLAELRAIPGVSEVSWTPTPKTYWESYATIEVGVREAFAQEQVSAIATTMNRYDGGGKSPALPVSFSIRLVGDDDAGFTVFGLGLPRDQVVENYRYWREITAVMGLKMRMDLHSTVSRRDYDMRVISAPTDVHPLQPLHQMVDHYDGLASLSSPEGRPADALYADGTEVFELWSIPGLQSSGSLPPRGVAELAERLSSLFPLRANPWITSEPEAEGSFPEGASIRWTNDNMQQQGRQVELLFPEYSEADWPAIVAAAAASSQLPGLNFQYYASDRDFFFHTSTCEGTVQPTVDDQALVDAVRASASLSSTSEWATPPHQRAGLGACIPERRPHTVTPRANRGLFHDFCR